MIEATTIGSFELSSRQLLLSDPCYQLGTKGQRSLRALPGTWEIKLHRDRGLLFMLEAHHERFPEVPAAKQGKVFVDSGMMSIYDRRHYRDEEEISAFPALEAEQERLQQLREKYNLPPGSRWDAARLLALKPLVTPHGAMITCGDDGEYPVLVSRAFHRSAAIRVMVLFDTEVLQ